MLPPQIPLPITNKNPHNKHEKKKLAQKIWHDDNYDNKKLHKRLDELTWARGLTELQLCKSLGIPLDVWDKIKRGVRRPSHTFIVRLMEVLGDEVQELFIGYYITDPFPTITPADTYKTDPINLFTQEQLKELKKKGIKLSNIKYRD